MMDFSAQLDGLDAAIDEHLRDAALLRRADGGADLPIRVHLERPTEAQRFDGVSMVQARPWIEISVRLAPALVKGDQVLMGPAAPWQAWRIAEAPKRPGDGRHWRAEVEALGQVLA